MEYGYIHGSSATPWRGATARKRRLQRAPDRHAKLPSLVDAPGNPPKTEDGAFLGLGARSGVGGIPWMLQLQCLHVMLV